MSGDPLPFEEEIRRFEELDRRAFPLPGLTLFVGSSTFTFWQHVAGDLAPLAVLNRGFGGSAYPDLLHYMGRIVLPYRPSRIVVYEGDNDVAGGRTPAQIQADAAEFARRVHAALATTPVLFLAIKPSPSRWTLWPTMHAANELVREYARTDPGLGFIDLTPLMLTADGQPRPELFLPDQLHLNPEGYRQWTLVLRRLLLPPAASPVRP